MKEYFYVGNKELLNLVKPELKGTCITSCADVELWMKQNYPKLASNLEITVTFVIDRACHLLINDRHSEHVVCANAQPILSAGEMTFECSQNKVNKITQITNQSTGYCPSPSSWDAVQKTLEKTDLVFPAYFTTIFIFRICQNCHWINVVKDDFYVCVNCEADLLAKEV
jgi:hypothetical protein